MILRKLDVRSLQLTLHGLRNGEGLSAGCRHVRGVFCLHVLRLSTLQQTVSASSQQKCLSTHRYTHRHPQLPPPQAGRGRPRRPRLFREPPTLKSGASRPPCQPFALGKWFARTRTWTLTYFLFHFLFSFPFFIFFISFFSFSFFHFSFFIFFFSFFFSFSFFHFLFFIFFFSFPFFHFLFFSFL